MSDALNDGVFCVWNDSNNIRSQLSYKSPLKPQCICKWISLGPNLLTTMNQPGARNSVAFGVWVGTAPLPFLPCWEGWLQLIKVIEYWPGVRCCVWMPHLHHHLILLSPPGGRHCRYLLSGCLPSGSAASEKNPDWIQVHLPLDPVLMATLLSTLPVWQARDPGSLSCLLWVQDSGAVRLGKEDNSGGLKAFHRHVISCSFSWLPVSEMACQLTFHCHHYLSGLFTFLMDGWTEHGCSVMVLPSRL